MVLHQVTEIQNQTCFSPSFCDPTDFESVMRLNCPFINTRSRHFSRSLNPCSSSVIHYTTLALQLESIGLYLVGVSLTDTSLERCHNMNTLIARRTPRPDSFFCLCVFTNMPSITTSVHPLYLTSPLLFITFKALLSRHIWRSLQWNQLHLGISHHIDRSPVLSAPLQPVRLFFSPFRQTVSCHMTRTKLMFSFVFATWQMLSPNWH